MFINIFKPLIFYNFALKLVLFLLELFITDKTLLVNVYQVSSF